MQFRHRRAACRYRRYREARRADPLQRPHAGCLPGGDVKLHQKIPVEHREQLSGDRIEFRPHLAIVHPWAELAQARVDLQAQRVCYEAFAKVWNDEPALTGVYFWNWSDGPGGDNDNSYTPRNKPAMKVIQAWFGAATTPQGAP